MKDNMRVIDLFAGVGWGVACKRLGIAEAGIEKMKEARASRAAADMVTIAEDVWDYDTSADEFEGQIASPPCQTFSAAGKGAGRAALDDVLQAIRDQRWRTIEDLKLVGKEVGDERTALVLTPLHYWWAANPTWVAWEQVPTVLPVWEACADVMRSAGYSVWTGNLQAEQYGVPQTRKRAFLLAHLDREMKPPTPTHSRYYPRNPTKLDEGVQKWVSMAEALMMNDLVDPAEPDALIPEILRSNYSTGGDSTTRGERTLNEPASTITSKVPHWVPPEWAYNRPSTTIVGTFKPEIVAAPGYRTTVSRQNQPDSVLVSVAEAGVLQSFAPDFPWQGSKSKQYLQCGNAVPPVLAEAVLSAVTGIKSEV